MLAEISTGAPVAIQTTGCTYTESPAHREKAYGTYAALYGKTRGQWKRRDADDSILPVTGFSSMLEVRRVLHILNVSNSLPIVSPKFYLTSLLTLN